MDRFVSVPAPSGTDELLIDFDRDLVLKRRGTRVSLNTRVHDFSWDCKTEAEAMTALDSLREQITDA